MLKETKDALQTDRVNKLLQKLAGLSPEKLNMALTMCGFYIDGMNDQERLAQKRIGA